MCVVWRFVTAFRESESVMVAPVDPSEAVRVLEAFKSGKLDHLFTAANTDYYEQEGFEALRFGVGVPRESVWHLISAIRRSTGLLVLESAWGDFRVRVMPTAQVMEALYRIDTAPARSASLRTQLPPDELWIASERQLVEEAVMIGIDATFAHAPSPDDVASVRTEVIGALYDDVTPAAESARIAARFYAAMRSLPQNGPERLDPEFIMGIHRMLCGDDPDSGVLRTTDDLAQEPEGLSVPASHIMAELEAMAAYSESQDVPFVHPLIKALGLAWWIRRVKPFDRYNYLISRVASAALALRHGYQAAGVRGEECRQLELPEGEDLTLLFIYQLSVLAKSATISDQELERRALRFREVTARFEHLDLNHRQALILDRALRSPDTLFTIKHHARTRQLGYETARQDFTKLVNAGLMERTRRGKAFVFRIAPGAEKKLKAKK